MEYFLTTDRRLYRKDFDALRTIEQVIVLGHSLSRIDFNLLSGPPSTAQCRCGVEDGSLPQCARVA